MTQSIINDRSMGFKIAFLAPKYWLTWCLIGLVGFASYLPRPLSIRVGDALGLLYQRFNRKRARIVRINLGLCFPELDKLEIDKHARDHFRFYGRSVIDFGLTWWAPKWRLRSLIQFKNEQNLLDTMKDHNVILLLPHMTGLDCGAGFSASLTPSITMMKPLENALINWRLWKGRTRPTGMRVIMRNQGLRPLIHAAKHGIACYYMPDEDFGESKLTVFAPFFGVQTSTLTTLSAMARLAKAKVVPIYPIMHENGHYEVTFDAPLDNFPSNDVIADATRVNQVVEKCISLAPAQYMWTLRWFKTRPEGETPPY